MAWVFLWFFLTVRWARLSFLRQCMFLCWCIAWVMGLVCDMSLCFCHFPIYCSGSGVVLVCNWSFPSSYFCNLSVTYTCFGWEQQKLGQRPVSKIYLLPVPFTAVCFEAVFVLLFIYCLLSLPSCVMFIYCLLSLPSCVIDICQY